MAPRGSVLLLGIGNPLRGDDGLGPSLARAVAARALPAVTSHEVAQLSVEHCAAFAEHGLTILADAATSGAAPFSLRPIRPTATIEPIPHLSHPAALVALARELYGARPRVVMLAMRGYAFDMFYEVISEPARQNLDAAVDWLLPTLARRQGPPSRFISP